MKQIQLTQDQIATVDDDDFERLSKFKWYCHTGGSGKQYAARRGFLKIVWMHREIMNPNSNMEIDHINGNGLDNRKENLRVCTTKENRRNRSKSSNNKSGYTGVSYHSGNKNWQAHIWRDGKRIYLGSFKTSELANEAYQKAAKETFGEYLRS